MVYFPACLGGSAMLRFGGYTAQVDGTVDMSTCLDAATGSPDSSLDVEVPQLQTGTTYCEFSTEVDTVILLKITAVDGGSVQFSATAWQAPDE